MTNTPSGFSFDLYPGLDRELDEIFTRNINNGEATPEAVAASGLATAVSQELQQSPDQNMSLDAVAWYNLSFINDPVGNWGRYNQQLGLTAPRTFDDIMLGEGLRRAPILQRLYEARQAIINSTELNPEGLNIGETMKPVLVPWRAIKENLDRFPEWVKEMRQAQGILDKDDFFSKDLLVVIQEGKKMYRNPEANSSTPIESQWLTATEYLDQRIEVDGDWGIILAQTSDDAGLKSIVEGPESERSPDAMTKNGTDHARVGGQDVDGLGIFEWLALTLQEDPTKLSNKDFSWLLANRLQVGDSTRVPIGYFYGDRVESDLNRSDYSNDNARVRLAVI